MFIYLSLRFVSLSHRFVSLSHKDIRAAPYWCRIGSNWAITGDFVAKCNDNINVVCHRGSQRHTNRRNKIEDVLVGSKLVSVGPMYILSTGKPTRHYWDYGYQVAFMIDVTATAYARTPWWQLAITTRPTCARTVLLTYDITGYLPCHLARGQKLGSSHQIYVNIRYNCFINTK